MSDFTELLNTPASEFKAPPPTPNGVYELTIEKWKKEERKTQNGNKNVIVVECKIAGFKSVDNPDEESMAQEAVNKKHSLEFWADPESIYRLTEKFMRDALGMDISQNLGSLLNELQGKVFLAKLEQEAWEKDGKSGVAVRTKQFMKNE